MQRLGMPVTVRFNYFLGELAADIIDGDECVSFLVRIDSHSQPWFGLLVSEVTARDSSAALAHTVPPDPKSIVEPRACDLADIDRPRRPLQDGTCPICPGSIASARS